MKDPIHLCDVTLFDGKAKRTYVIKDVVLAGNDKSLIWNEPTHRTRLLKRAFKTSTRIKTQSENLRLYIQDIEFRQFLGYSNYNWGLTK